MRLIFFLILVGSSKALSLNEIRQLYEMRKYSAIIGYYNDNPESFSGSRELEILAQAFYSNGDIKMAVRVCARVIDKSPGKMCLRTLRAIKERNPLTYEEEIGWFHMERGQVKDAFSKFYPLVRKYPQDRNLRRALAQVFQSMKLYDHMLEQLWQMDENEESMSLKQWLKLVAYRLRKRLSEQDIDQMVEQPGPYYLLIFLEQRQHPVYYEPLLSLYKERVKSGGSEEEQLHYANLLLIGDQINEARVVADRLESSVQKPLAVLSLESLQLRLPPKQVVSASETDQRREEPKQTINDQLLIQTTNTIDSSRTTHQRIDLFAPLDVTELKMATLENLKPFQDLHEIVRRKLAIAKNENERRWVYEQVKEPLIELDSSHLDPNIHPVERYFEKTEDGKKLTETLTMLAEEARAMDRKNSRRFEGEFERIRDQMSGAQSNGARERILSNFYYKWKAIAEGPYTDIRIKGGWEHYIETAEGTRLLQYVQSEVKKLGRLKEPLPYIGIQRY